MNRTNILVRHKLKDAMLQLLEQKHISEVSIKELIDCAHVGRVTFYRNYQTKEDIVLEALSDKLTDWAEALKNKKTAPSHADMRKAIRILEPTIRLLYSSGCEYILYLFIKDFNNIFQLFQAEDNQHRTLRAGIYFGMIDYWASNNFRESLPELTEMFKGHLHPFENIKTSAANSSSSMSSSSINKKSK